MPKLNHTGPDGQGSKTGRKLGNCHKNEDELLQTGEFGIGMGRRQHSNIMNIPGRRKRLNYFKPKNSMKTEDENFCSHQ